MYEALTTNMTIQLIRWESERSCWRHHSLTPIHELRAVTRITPCERCAPRHSGTPFQTTPRHPASLYSCELGRSVWRGVTVKPSISPSCLLDKTMNTRASGTTKSRELMLSVERSCFLHVVSIVFVKKQKEQINNILC